MPSINSRATFDFEGNNYYAEGVCEYVGPYAEFEGVGKLTIWMTPNQSRKVEAPADALARAAEEALDDEAQDDLYEARYGAHEAYGHPDDDYRDYDRGYSSGPDYWVDRESGEYRCG